MKWLVLFAVLIAGPGWGEDAAPLTVREKLRARIVESLPPPPAELAGDKPEPEGPVLVLEPIVVTESRAMRELETALVEDKQRKEAERFSLGKGGKIYSSERLELGGWWSRTTGWQFLKIKW